MRTIANMTIFLGIALAYVLIGIIATTIIILADGGDLLFLDEMWLGIFLWWFVLLFNAIRRYIKNRKFKKKK